MKYFIDTHDKAKGTFPPVELTPEQFFANFDALDEAGREFGVFAHVAHVSLEEGKTFCFMSGPTRSRFARHTPRSISPMTRSPRFGALLALTCAFRRG